MAVEATIGVIGGAVGLLLLAARLLWSLHKVINIGEHLVERVGTLESTLNNGIRSDVQAAAEGSRRAERLAADAARAASVASQHAIDGQQEISRAVNALRGEVDIYTNVVLSDRHRIRDALRELGLDISEGDIE